jgi:hypothetical protein
MNDASEWRRELARRIAPVYAAHPKVAAVILGGSAARGCADRFSDVELGIFWTALPADDERERLREQAGGVEGSFIPNSGRYPPPDPRGAGGLERYYLGGGAAEGFLVEVEHETVGGTEQCIGDVVERYDTSLSKQELIAVIQYGVPLAGQALVERWRARVSAYPDELARRMVREHLRVGPWGRKELYARRGEVLIVYEDLAWVGQRILLALMGLNRMYVPSDDFKWMERTIAAMPIAPPDLASRLSQVFHAEPVEGVRRLRAIMEETLSLVEAHLPEVDTAEARRQMRSWRDPWDHPPIDLV